MGRQRSDQNVVGHRNMMNGQKEYGRTWGICRDRSSVGEERETNRWIDSNALAAFFFLLILSSQTKKIISFSETPQSTRNSQHHLFLLVSFFSQATQKKTVCCCKSLYS